MQMPDRRANYLKAKQDVETVENNIENKFYGFHALEAQAVNIGTCAALPQAGCQCAFYTMLRQAGPTK
ncbi:hypothetical protein ACUTQ5_05380 [Serratia sp. NA_112.1]|uniref:hypothetical protein n=1 Tax=unclassified Serratia (in: enterobacteria) TaxID=2647522 RepID=UPI0040469A57